MMVQTKQRSYLFRVEQAQSALAQSVRQMTG